MKNGFVFINRKFVPVNKAALSVMDLTVQRGYAAFDVLRTYGRQPFLLDEHLRRLENSAKMMGMKNYAPAAEIRRVIAAGMKKTRGDTLIKILLTGGTGDHITPHGRSDLVVFFLPFRAHPESHYQKGFRMMTAKLQRVLPLAKSVDYFPAILAQLKAEGRGFDEAIFTDGQRVLEGTTFNIAVIRGRDFITPKKDVLEGITMLAVLRLVPRLGLRVVRRDLKFQDLRRADEMISTSTIREVLPVVQVDKIRIGAGRPGKYAKLLLKEIRKYATKNK